MANRLVPLGAIPALFRDGWQRMEELLFPPACVACGSLLDSALRGALFCPGCREQLILYREPCCQRCGAEVPQPLPASVPCGNCRRRKFRFERAIALGPYRGLLRELVLRAKHPAGHAIAIALGELLAAELASRTAGTSSEVPPEPIDVVCPIPMHWWRRLRRRANSPTVLSEVLARLCRLPLARGLLVRRRNTLPQFSLPPSGRFRNVRRAFAAHTGYSLSAAHVLLVDDILTTGATCNEAAGVLKRHGASQVTVAVVARSLVDMPMQPTR